MAIMVRVLAPNGTMATITPRSFTAGDYFRRFRELLFSSVVPAQSRRGFPEDRSG